MSPPSLTGETDKPAEPTVTTTTASIYTTIMIGLGLVVVFLWHLGAARLSYLKYGSIGWAIIDFFFASTYYPFYALFLAEGTGAPMMGGRRKLKLW